MNSKENSRSHSHESLQESQGHNPSRRKWLTTVGLLPLAHDLLSQPKPAAAVAEQEKTGGTLPAKGLFEVRGTFLNAAYTHPMSIATAEAARTYISGRIAGGRSSDEDMGLHRTETRAMFAKLINASPDELAWIPSTMVGENFVVAGLGLPGSSDRVVTDAYHFSGSLYLYGQLAKQGLDLHVLRPRDNRIDLNDLDAAITPKTKLVALSLVSTVNGFHHDLKTVCDLAHSRGALVFADIIQAAGAVPVDVHASGVDFCSCSSYKWLMGDFGVGFLYVRKDRLAQLKRSQFGYRQLAKFVTHTFPFDTPGEMPYEWEAHEDAGGHFQVGTLGNEAVAVLRNSLKYILDTDVEQIQKYRQPLIDRLQTELPKRGYLPMTAVNSTSPIVSFAFKDAAKILKPRLDAANINISVYENMFRISPSVYNDLTDINRLIDVLS